jgi:cellobiose phosphorylase
MYRAAVESLLGFQLRGDRLRIEPNVPAAWPKFEITWRWKRSTYHIIVHRPGVKTSLKEVVVDGVQQESGEIELIDDGETHQVTIGTPS